MHAHNQSSGLNEPPLKCMPKTCSGYNTKCHSTYNSIVTVETHAQDVGGVALVCAVWRAVDHTWVVEHLHHPAVISGSQELRGNAGIGKGFAQARAGVFHHVSAQTQRVQVVAGLERMLCMQSRGPLGKGGHR